MTPPRHRRSRSARSRDGPPAATGTGRVSREEQEDVWEIVWELRELLEAEHDTTSFNVGINAGEAAGQIVPHAHVHVIPRYPGDDPDPRGGIRWVLPDPARSWED